MTVRCTYCGTAFEPSPFANHQPQWCSQQCRREDWRIRQSELQREGSLPRDAPSPEAWDGRTRYSNVPEPTADYEAICGMCGRADKTERLTRRQAARRGQLGLGRCDACGGWRTLELAFGASSSPSVAVPVRTAAQPVLAVPRGRSL